VVAPSKAWVCGGSLPGIAGSNLAGSMDVCPCECRMLIPIGLCDGLITRPED
jgi:hypothetical protein